MKERGLPATRSVISARLPARQLRGGDLLPSDPCSINPLLVSLLTGTPVDRLPERLSVDMLPGKYVKTVAHNVNKVSRRRPQHKAWLVCRRCQRKEQYDIGLVVVNFDDKREAGADPTDSKTLGEQIQCTGYFRCKHCDAAEWDLPAKFQLSIITHLMLARFKTKRLVTVGALRLFDGFLPRWATDGESHLLERIQVEGQDAYLWNRLGNLYWAGWRPELAMAAFEQSLRLDGEQVESCFSIGGMLYDLGEIEEGEKYFQKALLHAWHYDRLAPDSLKEMVAVSLLNLVLAHPDDPDKVRFPVRTPKPGETLEPTTLATKTFTLDPHKPETFYPLAELYLGIGSGSEEPDHERPAKRGKRKHIGRNAPCPCGSGKKYKRCCGRTA